jgi:hypothetical protein
VPTPQFGRPAQQFFGNAKVLQHFCNGQYKKLSFQMMFVSSVGTQKCPFSNFSQVAQGLDLLRHHWPSDIKSV